MVNKRSQTESIGALLEHSLKRLDLATRLEDYAIWPIWNDVVGNTIAQNAQPEKIRNGTLFVKVSSPVWMQQLQFLKDMIVGKLNHRLKAARVKNIFFMVGRLESTADLVVDPSPVSQQAPAQLDDDFLKAIADPEMRAAFGRLLRSYSRRRSGS